MRVYLFGINSEGYYTVFLANGLKGMGSDILDICCLFCFQQPLGEDFKAYGECLKLFRNEGIIDDRLTEIALQVCGDRKIRIIPTTYQNYPLAETSQVRKIMEKYGYTCS